MTNCQESQFSLEYHCWAGSGTAGIAKQGGCERHHDEQQSAKR
jgi:hypothetical protein